MDFHSAPEQAVMSGNGGSVITDERADYSVKPGGTAGIHASRPYMRTRSVFYFSHFNLSYILIQLII